MKKSVLMITFSSVFLMSCGEAGNSAEGEKIEVKASLSSEDLTKKLEAFKACKDTSSEAHACKTFVVEAFESYYGYTGFRKADGKSYINYDDVLKQVSESADWNKLGPAHEQAVLRQAQDLANQGVGVIAVSTKNNSLAIVVKGSLSHSNSMGLDCPTVAVFRPKRVNNSFIGKGMNYAWSDFSKVQIFALK